MKGTDPCSWDVVMAYLLCGAACFMQTVLIYLVFQEVVMSNVEWQNGIMQTGSGGVGLFQQGGLGGTDGSKCNDASSLCFNDNGNFSCAPPSIQLTGRWEDLDTNKDGTWTREEVIAAEETLKCKYAVNPVEVFDVLINMIKKRSHLIWIHPDIAEGKAIHFAYFQYAIGDITMCGYRSDQMCPNLVQRGYFDSAFIHGTAPRVGKTTETALHYCRSLLQDQGVCEELLPSTYTVWKIASGMECGSESYSKFKYKNPGTKLTKSLLEVDYSARGEYELAQGNWFRIFKGIVLAIWTLIMYCEYKEIIKFVALAAYFPDANEYGEDYVLIEQDPADPEDVRYRLQGISQKHRVCIAVLCVVRMCLTTSLCVVGMSYIIKTNSYPDLLMNGVALAFVAEIAAVLYAQVLREEIRDQTEDIKPIKVPMFGIYELNKLPALVDILGLLLVFVVCYAIMEWQLKFIVKPVFAALECTCLQVGEDCYEAQLFDNQFWNNYWYKTVPWIYSEVEKMKAALPAGAASYVAANAGSIISANSGKTSQEPALAIDESTVKKVDASVAQLEATDSQLFKRLDKLEHELSGGSNEKRSPSLIQKSSGKHSPSVIQKQKIPFGISKHVH
jgi:hypothetical protein